MPSGVTFASASLNGVPTVAARQGDPVRAAIAGKRCVRQRWTHVHCKQLDHLTTLLGGVVSGKLVIGGVYRQMLSGQAVHWSWHLLLNGPQTIVHKHGSADSLDDAEAELETNWRAWVALAGLHE